MDEESKELQPEERSQNTQEFAPPVGAIPVEPPPMQAVPVAPPPTGAVAPSYSPSPPPPPPPPPARSWPQPSSGGKRGMGGGGVFMVALFTAIITSLVILVGLPLIFRQQPHRFPEGQGPGESQRGRPGEPGFRADGGTHRRRRPGSRGYRLEEDPARGGQHRSDHHRRHGHRLGSIIRADGYILTNNHVVADARSIKVALLDGKVLDARVIGTDPDNDLAVIKIDQSSLPVAELGNSADLVVGELAVAMGSPEGFETERHQRHRQRAAPQPVRRIQWRAPVGRHPDRRRHQPG